MRTLWPVAFAALVLAASARANDVELAVTAKVPIGTPPAVTLKIKKDVKRASLDIKSSAGARVRRSGGPKEAGGELVFKLEQSKPGRAQWSGTLEVEFEDGTAGSMPLAFATEVLSSFKFKLTEDTELIKKNIIELTSEHDTSKIEVEVYGEGGELLAGQGFPQDNVKAGTPMRVEWLPKKDGLVLRIHVVVHDTAGAFQSSDSFPYTISIPHEEVEFEFGKADVRATEEPKLVKAVTEIERATKLYADAVKVEGVQIRLFVHGHTDTVGSPGANQALSERRARAIASWFAKRGVKVTIYARGFGESALKVDTPDETENQQNRRVDYDVAVNPPAGSLGAWARVN
jgi:outer membrane protein OmpA-like peptidoglycan-associated protein